MQLTTVTHEFDQPIRHINQLASGGSYFAVFTLRLTPTPGSHELAFECPIEIPDPFANWPTDRPDPRPAIVAAIEQGIRQFEDERRKDGKPIGSLKASLVAIAIHPSDIRIYRFAVAAVLAMREAFAAHETLLSLLD